MKSDFRRFAEGVGLLAGAIIGAGVFALPAAFARAGIVGGALFLFLACLAYTLVHLMYGDLVLRTPGEHRFVGYAARYLGPVAGRFTILMAVVEMLLVLVAYLVLSLSFMGLVFGPGNELGRLIVFWAIGSFIIFLSTRRIAALETIITACIVLIIFTIFGAGLFPALRHGLATHPIVPANFDALLFPLPLILFALSGRVAIPALIKFLREGGNDVARLTRNVVMGGTVLSAALYTLFVIGILGLSPAVSDDAVAGLIGFVSPVLLFLVGLLGLASLLSSYMLVGLDVKDTLRYDLRFPRLLAFFAVVAVPIFLYALGFQQFLTLVSFIGGIFLGLEGILITVIWIRAHRALGGDPLLLRRPHLVTFAALFLVFGAALLYEIVK